MKKKILNLSIGTFILAFSSFSQGYYGHHHHHHHCHNGNGLFNALIGISYTSSGLTTSTEATAYHDHFGYHRHGHWKKQAQAVLDDIKIYRNTGELTSELMTVLDKNEKLKNLKKEEKINFIENAIKLIFLLEENKDSTTP